MFFRLKLTALLMMAVMAVSAGNNKGKFTTNGWNEGWFIGAGVGTQFYVGDSDNLHPAGYRFSTALEGTAGKWINPTLGLRLQATAARVTGGNIKGKKDAMNMVNGHLDFMVDAMNLFLGTDEDRKFTAVPLIGLGCAVNAGSKETCFSLNVGAQAIYKVASNINLFAELKGSLLNDKMDGFKGGSKGEGSAVLSAGFTFGF